MAGSLTSFCLKWQFCFVYFIPMESMWFEERTSRSSREEGNVKENKPSKRISNYTTLKKGRVGDAVVTICISHQPPEAVCMGNLPCPTKRWQFQRSGCALESTRSSGPSGSSSKRQRVSHINTLPSPNKKISPQDSCWSLRWTSHSSKSGKSLCYILFACSWQAYWLLFFHANWKWQKLMYLFG